MKRKSQHEKFMQLALREARKNLLKPDGGPFGAVIIKKGRVVSIARNTVLKNDATCHAEINAIRLASKKLKTYNLSGCRIYSTTEPCPMCFSAIHWARIGSIIYGNNIADAEKIGFNELFISNVSMKKIGKAKIKIVRGVLRDECNRLFREWSVLPDKQLY